MSYITSNSVPYRKPVYFGIGAGMPHGTPQHDAMLGKMLETKLKTASVRDGQIVIDDKPYNIDHHNDKVVILVNAENKKSVISVGPAAHNSSIQAVTVVSKQGQLFQSTTSNLVNGFMTELQKLVKQATSTPRPVDVPRFTSGSTIPDIEL